VISLMPLVLIWGSAVRVTGEFGKWKKVSSFLAAVPVSVSVFSVSIVEKP
jgi:hypothetical protein